MMANLLLAICNPTAYFIKHPPFYALLNSLRDYALLSKAPFACNLAHAFLILSSCTLHYLADYGFVGIRSLGKNQLYTVALHIVRKCDRSYHVTIIIVHF